MTEYLENGKKSYLPKLPVRAVLNRKTFTAFSGLSYNDHRISFLISKTKFIKLENPKNCFQLYENKFHFATFCDFGIQSSLNFINEWDYDFNLFKYQCKSDEDKRTGFLNQELQDKMSKVEVINIFKY